MRQWRANERSTADDDHALSSDVANGVVVHERECRGGGDLFGVGVGGGVKS